MKWYFISILRYFVFSSLPLSCLRFVFFCCLPTFCFSVYVFGHLLCFIVRSSFLFVHSSAHSDSACIVANFRFFSSDIPLFLSLFLFRPSQLFFQLLSVPISFAWPRNLVLVPFSNLAISLLFGHNFSFCVYLRSFLFAESVEAFSFFLFRLDSFFLSLSFVHSLDFFAFAIPFCAFLYISVSCCFVAVPNESKTKRPNIWR